jgi:hypothetical protein
LAASIGLIGSFRTVAAAQALPATTSATATLAAFIFIMTLLLACSANPDRSPRPNILAALQLY